MIAINLAFPIFWTVSNMCFLACILSCFLHFVKNCIPLTS